VFTSMSKNLRHGSSVAEEDLTSIYALAFHRMIASISTNRLTMTRRVDGFFNRPQSAEQRTGLLEIPQFGPKEPPHETGRGFPVNHG
jgi:hypothetical protein